ncbi:MAG: hypothetical protein IT249_08120 [Chitinophagaceae bacterium]|nr:hypothetical protein [Chitinophagaceae bacterium]
MKVKHAVIILALGYSLNFIGAFMKIMHRASADIVLLLSTICSVWGIVLLLYKLITYPKIKDFMNW